LLELQDQKFRRAIEEYYGLDELRQRVSDLTESIKKSDDTRDDLPQESKGDES
jgi:hypothetical protein